METAPVPFVLVLVLALATLPSLAQSPVSAEKITQWRGLLRSDDPEVRSMAVHALLGADQPAAINAIREALYDRANQAARLTILKGIVLNGDDRFTRDIIFLLDDPDPKVAEAAASTLVAGRSPQVVDMMVEALRGGHPSVVVRCKLARTLAEMRELRAVPALIEMLSADEEPARRAALESLEKITMRSLGFDQAAWSKWWEEWKDRPREQLLEDVIRLQGANIRQLSDLASALWIKLLTLQDLTKDPRPLREAMESNFPAVQVFAAKKLAEVKPEGCVDLLIPPLKSPHSQVREAAAAGLGDIGDKKAVGPLVAALSDPEPTVASQAAASLGRLKAAESLPALLQLLGSGATDAAAAAVKALGEIGDARAVEPLAGVLQNDRLERSVREEAAASLGKIPSATGLPALLAALDDTDDRIRWAAADSLGRLGLAEAVPGLGRVLGADKDPRVREVAALSLGRIRAREGLPYLLSGMDDRESRVAEQSVAALLGILDTSVDAYSNLATDMINKGDSAKAVRLGRAALDRIAKQDPTKDLSALNKVQALGLMNLKKWAEARKTLEKLLETNREDKTLYEKTAACYFEMGDHEALVALTSTGLKKFPADAAKWIGTVLPSLEALIQARRAEVVTKFIDGLDPPTLQALPEDLRNQLARLKERCTKPSDPVSGETTALISAPPADPAAHKQAVARLVVLGEKAVPALIQSGLASNDRRVLDVTLEALEKITGHSFGLTPEATAEQRQAAIRAWIEWWRRKSAGEPKLPAWQP